MSYKESIPLKQYLEENEQEYNRAMDEAYFILEEQWNKLDNYRKCISDAKAAYEEATKEKIN
jgi:hypothetical protein